MTYTPIRISCNHAPHACGERTSTSATNARTVYLYSCRQIWFISCIRLMCTITILIYVLLISAQTPHVYTNYYRLFIDPYLLMQIFKRFAIQQIFILGAT